MAQILTPKNIEEIVSFTRERKPKPKVIVLLGRHEPFERTIGIAENANEFEEITFIQFPYKQQAKGFYLGISDALDEMVDDMCRGIKVAGDIFSSRSYKRYGEMLSQKIEHDNNNSTDYLKRAIKRVRVSAKRDYCYIFDTNKAWDLYFKLWDILQEKAGFVDNDKLINMLRKDAGINKRTLFIDLHCTRRQISDPYWGKFKAYEKRLRKDVRYNRAAGICTPYTEAIDRVLQIRKKLERVCQDAKPVKVSKYVCGNISHHKNYHDGERSFIIEFFQEDVGNGRLELSEDEKKRIIPAVNFSFMFDHRLGENYLVSARVGCRHNAQHAASLNCFLKNILACHHYITD